MRLVPFQHDHLRIGEPLPFGLRDQGGRLLLAGGQVVENEDRLEELRSQSLFADQFESADWFRRLAGAVDARIREGVELREVATARPGAVSREAAAAKELTLPDEWHEIISHLDGVLRAVQPDTDWRPRLMAIHGRARVLGAKRLDGSLYFLIFEAGQSTKKYSSHHALLTMLICEQAATLLGWEQPHIDSLGRSALVMNVSMLRLQDLLASDSRPPTPQARAEIETHAQRSAQMLADAGLSDALCLEVVRLHHDAAEVGAPLATLPPELRLAQLLRRVDIFTAQISLRASRAPISPVQAAREACLGADGTTDEIGGALLRAVGLYPPGSYVQLDNGEIGLVVARGRRANTPFVAALLSPSGSLIAEPALRDSLDRRYAIKSAVPASTVKLRPPHERLLAMRIAANLAF